MYQRFCLRRLVNARRRRPRNLPCHAGDHEVGNGPAADPAELRRAVLKLRLLRRDPHRRRRGPGLARHAAGHRCYDELALH